MFRATPLAYRTVAVATAALTGYSASAAGFNALTSSGLHVLVTDRAKVQRPERIPWLSERPLPVFRGQTPSRDATRERIWNSPRRLALEEIESARVLRQSLEHGEGYAAIGAFAVAAYFPSFTSTASGGAGLPGEASVPAGDSGTLNTNTGNKATTLSFAGWTSRAGMEVPFTLVHNSTGAFDGSAGKGWSHSYEAGIAASGSTAVVRMPDGLSLPFTASGSDYTPPEGRHEILASVTGGGWKLTFKNRTVWNFNASGDLTSQVDRSGNTISLSRDGAGLLTKVIDPVGRDLKFTYNAANRIETVKDPRNRIWTLGYNANGNLTSIAYPDMANGLGAPVRTFGYDGSDRITSEVDLRGKTWTAQYDSSGRLWKLSNPLAQTTTYTYTASSTRIDLPLALGSGQVHNYSAGLLVSKVDEVGFSEANTAYDADRNVLSTTDKSGKVWTSTWDLQGNLLTKTNPLNNTWTYTYAPTNELLTETTPLGRVMTYGIDAAGRTTTVTDDLGHAKSTVTYDGFGQATSVTDALGRATATNYLGSGVPYRKTTAAGVITNFSYDSDGRINAMSDGAGKLWLYGKDGWGRPNGTTFPGGSYTLNTYDGNGNLVSARDELGRVTSSTYDNAGRRLSTANPKGEVTYWGYNGNGWLGAMRDGNFNLRSYGYNPRGDLYFAQLADGTIEYWAWSGRGEETYHQRPDASVVTKAFDDAGRLTLVNNPSSIADESFGYDLDNRRTTMVDATGTTSWAIDNADRITAIYQPYGTISYTYNNADQRTLLTEAGAGSMTYYYFPFSGILGSVINRFGETTNFSYDTLGRLYQKGFTNGASETFGYDNRDRRNLITLKNNTGVTTRTEAYVYNNASEMTSHTVNGTATNYAYDPAGQLTSESRPGYSGTYTYDTNGNRLSRTVNGVAETMAYDVADKLLTVKVGGVTQVTYGYNAMGSVTSIATPSAGTTTIVWDANDRPTAMNGPGLATTYAYNADGARLKALETVSTGATARYEQRDGTEATASVVQDNVANSTPGISEYRAGYRSYLHGGVKNFTTQTDPSSAIVGTRQYDAFGNVLATTGTFRGQYGYGGLFGYREDPTKLKLLGHRLYDPSIGRFLSRDRDKTARNMYNYCDNSPLTLAEPDGRGAVSVHSLVGPGVLSSGR